MNEWQSHKSLPIPPMIPQIQCIRPIPRIPRIPRTPPIQHTPIHSSIHQHQSIHPPTHLYIHTCIDSFMVGSVGTDGHNMDDIHTLLSHTHIRAHSAPAPTRPCPHAHAHSHAHVHTHDHGLWGSLTRHPCAMSHIKRMCQHHFAAEKSLYTPRASFFVGNFVRASGLREVSWSKSCSKHAAARRSGQ